MRPTVAQVDKVLVYASEESRGRAVDILAAEVRALRRELDEAQTAAVNYSLKLGRIEALPAKWREAAAIAHNHWDRPKTHIEEGVQAGTLWAADDLENELHP